MSRLLIPALVAAFALSPVAAAMTPSDVRTCNSLASGFKTKTAAYETAQAERDEAAAEAELAGDAWEEAEDLRLFSDENAIQADTALMTYNAAKADFEMAEAAVQEQGMALNFEISRYNARCVKD